MKVAALAAFPAICDALEGTCLWPYIDVLDKVTTGQGYLCDSIAEMQRLPWQRPDGTPASPAEVADAYRAVKGATAIMRQGGASRAMQSLTTIRLTREAVDDLTRAKVLTNETILRSRIGAACYDALCADAQFGLASLAWACGPMMAFPKLLRAVQAGDWITAAAECEMTPEANPGNHLERRNALDLALFSAAARVASLGLDPDVLHYQDDVAEASPVTYDRPTTGTGSPWGQDWGVTYTQTTSFYTNYATTPQRAPVYVRTYPRPRRGHLAFVPLALRATPRPPARRPCAPVTRRRRPRALATRERLPVRSRPGAPT